MLNPGHPGKIGMVGPPPLLMFLRQRERNLRDLRRKEKVEGLEGTVRSPPAALGGKRLSETFRIWLGREGSTSWGRINLKIYVFRMIGTIVLHLYFESGFHKYCCFLMFIAE